MSLNSNYQINYRDYKHKTKKVSLSTTIEFLQTLYGYNASKSKYCYRTHPSGTNTHTLPIHNILTLTYDIDSLHNPTSWQ
jgi:hypothetical protein